MQGLVLININVGMKCLLTFVLKNPLDFPDDFWTVYLMSLGCLGSILADGSMVFQHGFSKRGLSFYVFTGQKPKRDNDSNGKYFIETLKAVSICFTTNILIWIDSQTCNIIEW